MERIRASYADRRPDIERVLVHDRIMRGVTACLLSGALLVACGNTTGSGGQGDLLGVDLAGADFAGADLSAGGGVDLAITDLGGYSDVGGPCGGFTSNPKRCLPGLVCAMSTIPDVPGTCERADGAACQPNGGGCIANGDCCSNNCILRSSPGYCCQPGGCP
jgi:hypothetical protein